jgi:hypothetical protein
VRTWRCAIVKEEISDLTPAHPVDKKIKTL